MAKIFVHLPLNISRAVEEMLKEFGREIENKHGIKVEVESQHQCQPENGRSEKQSAEDIEDNLPDLLIGHVNYFSKYPENFLEEHFCSLPGRFPLRPELAEAGFADPKGYFHPFVVIPFAIFYNPNVLEEKELPGVWEDLTENRWREKILMPDEYHMAPRMVRAFMQRYYPKKYADFQHNLVYQGAPINVVNAVDEGLYPLGITNISFARISRSKNIRLLWPRDGMFCMPQVMVWNKKADERLLEIGDFLLSQHVQEYLALQTFVPVSEDTPIPQLLKENNFSLRWKGWEDFLNAINGAK